MKRNATKKAPAPPRTRVRAPIDDQDDDDEPLELEKISGAGGFAAGGEESDEDIDEELAALRQELGEAANAGRVVVHKVVPNGDPQRCFSCPLAQFYSDSIREQWGAGTFSYMVYVGNKLKTRGRISFAEPIAAAAAAPLLQAQQQQLLVPGADRAAADLEARIEARLEREQARHFELLKLITGNRQTFDPMQLQAQMLSMLTTVKELTGGGGSDRSSIELFLEGVKTAHKFGGGEGGGATDWGGIVASVVEGARALALEQRARPAQARLPAPASSSAASSSTSSPTSTSSSTQAAAGAAVIEPAEDDADMMKQLQKALQFLVRKAQAGANAELYADVAIDNLGELPKILQPMILDYLMRDDAIERLIQLEPAIAQHRAWFTALVAEIRRVISSQSSAPTLTPDGASNESAS